MGHTISSNTHRLTVSTRIVIGYWIVWTGRSTLYDMANRTDHLVSLALDFQRRGIKTTIEPKPHPWAPAPIPTLTGDAYLGHVEVTVNTGTYRWLNRSGAVRLARPDDTAAVVARIIEDRAGTMNRPEPDMSQPPPPLPRRTAPGRYRPMANP